MEIDWQNLLRGLRKELGLSPYQLSDLIGVPRRTLARYEEGYRRPFPKYANKLLNFIKSQNLSLEKLESVGKSLPLEEVRSDIHLEKSADLAEFIGILLGDGDTHLDGAIRISFDPKKEPKYLKCRVFPLIKKLFDKIPTYESDKRIVFYSRNVILFLRDSCDLKIGNKVKNKAKIPDWCFEKDEYFAAVLRGLFDTDGYFAYKGRRVVVMFGRFAEGALPLVKSICAALESFGIQSTYVSRDHRKYVTIQDEVNALKFFTLCGVSNPKHIVRFLLWRLNKQSARIEIEGIDALFSHLKNLGFDIDNINVPFVWNSANEMFAEQIAKDTNILHGAKIREYYDWSELISALLNEISQQKISEALKINTRSVRKWREGRRFPSFHFVPYLLELAENNNIKVEKYANRNDRTFNNGR